MNKWRPPSGGWSAFLLYLVLSIALTWPLVLGLGSDVPGDLGDSLLNMWILAWGAEHVPRLLTGAMPWSEFWNANIFHPEPLTFALSENLLGQTLQILPIYWLTGNIILCYNLLFISTFALSAFGTYLLVRDLTGNTRAAFIAGLVYGFLPYRIASIPHLQVLSSQWMPFALWGFNHFITRFPPLDSAQGGPGLVAGPDPRSRFPARAALALGTGALILQNWSCVYYVLFFAPFLLLFVLHRMSTTGKLRDLRLWAHLAAGAAVTLALTLPVLLPYRQAHERFGIERDFNEAAHFSANVWSYVTASENLLLWGRALRFYPYGEGETFLGFVPWLLAFVALASLIARGAAPVAAPAFGRGIRWRDSWAMRVLKWILVIIAASQFIALMSTMMFGGFSVDVFGIRIRARTAPRLLLQFMVSLGALLALSARARQFAAHAFRSPIAFFLFAVVLAIWLSLGPAPAAGQATVTGFGLYGVLHDFVPGFNGLRVPARFAMIAGLFLAILAGYGTKLLAPKFPLFAVLALVILLEGFAVPIEINRTWNMYEAAVPARVFPRSQAPGVYQRIAGLPAQSVVTEFPFGDRAWEIRYVYYSAAHWKPITNGYSGGFPPGYNERVARLQRIAADPAAAWQTLRAAGTTHVVIHRNAFANPQDADAVEAWLRSHGATELERFAEGDMLFRMPS